MLDDHRHAELFLSDLVDAASSLLTDAAPPADERVARVPDARTVRYYQSVGLVDRPRRYQGRRAVYGFRHLLQVVAVKLLQGQGYSLSRVQEGLAGQPTPQLEHAVRQALGLAAAEPSTASPDALVSARLAPGVIVTVDPSLIDDPEALITILHNALREESP